MASYHLSFKCDTCEEIAVASIVGINTYRQEEIFSTNAAYEAVCNNGHRSTYFVAQLVEVHRKLSPLERQAEPELLEDDRFVDIE